MIRSTRSLCIVALLLIAYSGHAQAYSYNWSCTGSHHVRWNAGDILWRESCSAPDGSTAAQAFPDLVSSWNDAVYTSPATINYNPNNSVFNASCSPSIANGYSEMGLEDRGDMDNSTGLTICLHSYSCLWSDDLMIECDVRVATDMNMNSEDESWWNFDQHEEGRVAMLHELGHLLGLGHSEWYDIMRTHQPIPIVGGSGRHAEPFPDDVAGVKALFNQSPNVVRKNLFVSAQKFSANGTLEAVNAESASSQSGIETIDVYRGGTVDVWYSAGNNGTVDLSNITFRVYLSNDLATPTYLWLNSNSAHVYKMSYFTEHQIFTIPYGLSPGFYWIMWDIDSSGSIGEYYENDNRVHSGLTLQVH